MMKPILTALPSLIPKQKRPVVSSGFTLVELLAATVMSSIVISSLLYVMIDVARSSAAETARKNTLQDMRQSLEFITNDLKEAVYVYTGDQLADRDILAGNNDGVADIINADNGLEPILVFWKLEDVPYNDSDSWPNNCGDGAVSEDQGVCNQLRIAQRTYTLVAYVQDTDPTNTWKGDSIIYRYELRKYFNSNANPFSTLNEKPEYVDPVQESSFPNWPYQNDNTLPNGFTNLTINRGNVDDGGFSAALVDFVDKADNADIPNGEVGCPNGFVRTPTNASDFKSFYACVEEGDTAGIPAEDATITVKRFESSSHPKL